MNYSRIYWKAVGSAPIYSQRLQMLLMHAWVAPLRLLAWLLRCELTIRHEVVTTTGIEQTFSGSWQEVFADVRRWMTANRIGDYPATDE